MLIALSFIYGLFIGSFLNVIIDRVPLNKSFITGRSHCDFCKHTLAWFDLIPLFSYLFLSGKCRYCHRELSIYYPLIEFTTACLFAFAAYLQFGSFPLPYIPTAFTWLQFIIVLITISVLVIVFFADFRYGIIPFIAVIPASLLLVIWYEFLSVQLFSNHLLSGLVTMLLFLGLFLGTKGKGLGFGDVVYAFFMGVALGFPTIIPAVYLAIILGAAYGIGMLLYKKKKLHGATMPFGPFLVLGTLICLFYGPEIWRFISLLIGLPGLA